MDWVLNWYYYYFCWCYISIWSPQSISDSLVLHFLVYIGEWIKCIAHTWVIYCANAGSSQQIETVLESGISLWRNTKYISQSDWQCYVLLLTNVQIIQPNERSQRHSCLTFLHFLDFQSLKVSKFCRWSDPIEPWKTSTASVCCQCRLSCFCIQWLSRRCRHTWLVLRPQLLFNRCLA